MFQEAPGRTDATGEAIYPDIYKFTFTRARHEPFPGENEKPSHASPCFASPSMRPPNYENDYLFSLLPLNKLSEKVLQDAENEHHVGALNLGSSPKNVLHIGFAYRAGELTLATIGREGSIVVRAPNISRVHLSFEIVRETLEIVTYDRSSNQTTSFLGPEAESFKPDTIPRRVLVDPEHNTELGFGGAQARQFRFQLLWRDCPVHQIRQALGLRRDDPRHARTLEDFPDMTATHHPISVGGVLPKAHWRFADRLWLGTGGFGVVMQVIDIDSGQTFAVKRIKRPDVGTHRQALLQREVDALRKLRHVSDKLVKIICWQSRLFEKPHIIALRGAQWNGSHLELIMDVQDGNVDKLTADGIFTREPALCDCLLYQMLQALDYLACQEIIHRDVKPENILFKRKGVKKYVYQLADFGLANTAQEAKTFAGTRKFMPPEVAIDRYRCWEQTPKMDVWSLFATLVDVLNVGSFRETEYTTDETSVNAICSAAEKHPVLNKVAEMAAINPAERATARDILIKIFDDQGVTVKRKIIRVGTEKLVRGVTPVAVAKSLRPKRLLDIAPAQIVKPRHDKAGRKRHEPSRNGPRTQVKRALPRAGVLALRIPGAFPNV